MGVIRMYLAALRRALGPSIGPLMFLLVLFFLAYRTFGTRGAGLPHSQVVLPIVGWITPLLVSSLSLGFAVMAIIQLFKPELRAAFHSEHLARWLHFRNRGGLWPSELSLLGIAPENFGAVLELPIEQLAAQIQAAFDAEVASRSPRSQEFLERILGKLQPWELYAQMQEPDDPKSRAVLGYLVQRKLDELQIRVHHGWRRLLRSLSLSLSLALTAFVASILGLWRQNLIGTAFAVLLFAALGGFFASAARDIVAVVERLRT